MNRLALDKDGQWGAERKRSMRPGGAAMPERPVGLQDAERRSLGRGCPYVPGDFSGPVPRMPPATSAPAGTPFLTGAYLCPALAPETARRAGRRPAIVVREPDTGDRTEGVRTHSSRFAPSSSSNLAMFAATRRASSMVRGGSTAPRLTRRVTCLTVRILWPPVLLGPTSTRGEDHDPRC